MQTRCDVIYNAGKLSPVCYFYKVRFRQATTIVSKRKLLNSFRMWASDVSSSAEGYYYTVSFLSKQRMWTSQYTFSEFVLKKWFGTVLQSTNKQFLNLVFLPSALWVTYNLSCSPLYHTFCLSYVRYILFLVVLKSRKKCMTWCNCPAL